MKIFRDIEKIDIASPVVSIGIFDGVHKAHQEILGKIRQLAKELKGESVLITLWPHPRYVLRNDKDLQLLTSLDEKLVELEKSGIDNLIILPFTKELAAMPFDKFVQNILVDKLKAKHLIVGYNHQFGKNREGNFERLKTLAEYHNFGIEKLSQYIIDNTKVSSSQIRELIKEGEITKANSLLGYNFYLNGSVVKGHEIGRTIGFPTANIKVDEALKIIPANGVYAIKASIDGEIFNGMLNIGYRPTINNNKMLAIEAHIFNFDKNIYNKQITISFLTRIRDEQKFSSLKELKSQLEKDAVKIKNLI